MTTGSQIHRSSEDKYVEDVYVTTKDLNFDVDIMSRKDIMTLGMRPINKFRAENRLILINENQLVSTLATLCSMMMIATGLNDLITSYTYIHASETLSWGCMDISDANDFVNKFKPKSDFIKSISWIWLSCGIWGGILPLCTGFMMNCSTNLSAKSPVNEGTYFGTIFYNANFPPKNPPGVKLFRLLSIVDLIVVFLLSVINTAVSSHCIGPRYPITKYVFPLVVCFLCVILFFLIFISPWIKRRQLSKDENLHVGHTHILVRKFPVVGTDRKYVEPRLVNYGPPVNLPWKPAQPRPPSWTHLDDEWKNY